MTWTEYLLEEARKIIKSCEELQSTNESAYSKEHEKKIAYEKIKELLEVSE